MFLELIGRQKDTRSLHHVLKKSCPFENGEEDRRLVLFESLKQTHGFWDPETRVAKVNTVIRNSISPQL